MVEKTLSEFLPLDVTQRLRMAAALPLAEEQRQEILRRSEAHRNNPQEAIPLEEAVERIRRSL